MNVKLQAILNAARWVEEQHGKNMLARVLARCRAQIRERFETGIAIEWIPMTELMEFYEAVVEIVGAGDRSVLRATGASSARKNLRRPVTRVATWLLSPDLFIQRVSSLWRQYNDAAELVLLDLRPGLCLLEIRGVPVPHWGFCTSLLGWADELALAFGWKNAMVRHPECRAEGDSRCIIEIRHRG
jgi:hypothetical protein